MLFLAHKGEVFKVVAMCRQNPAAVEITLVRKHLGVSECKTFHDCLISYLIHV